MGCFIYPRVTIKTLSSPCKLFDVVVKNENWQDLFFTQNVKKVSFGIKIANKCFPLFMKKVNFGIKIVKDCFPLFVKKVGFGALTAPEALLKINEALKATEGRTESQRKGILKGIIGDKDYIDFLGTQGFTTTFAEQTTDRVNDASFDVKAKEQ